MTDNDNVSTTYEQLKNQAILGCTAAADIMESCIGQTDAAFVATAFETVNLILAGAQVYATLAVAEAEKDSMREFQERTPKRTTRPPLNPIQPRPVTPINKFQKDSE